jgi:hypothetical protein
MIVGSLVQKVVVSSAKALGWPGENVLYSVNSGRLGIVICIPIKAFECWNVICIVM